MSHTFVWLFKKRKSFPQKTVRANQEHVEVLRKPVKVARIYVQLLQKVIQVKSKFEKILLDFYFKLSKKF